MFAHCLRFNSPALPLPALPSHLHRHSSSNSAAIPLSSLSREAPFLPCDLPLSLFVLFLLLSLQSLNPVAVNNRRIRRLSSPPLLATPSRSRARSPLLPILALMTPPYRAMTIPLDASDEGRQIGADQTPRTAGASIRRSTCTIGD